MRKALRFLNFLSYDGTLSWTNIALVGCVVKFWASPAANYADLAAVLVTVGNYAMKRQSNQKVAEIVAKRPVPTSAPLERGPSFEQLESLQNDLRKVKTALGMRGIVVGPDKEPAK